MTPAKLLTRSLDVTRQLRRRKSHELLEEREAIDKTMTAADERGWDRETDLSALFLAAIEDVRGEL